MFIVFFRSIILYLCITFSMRLMGKRQLGEFQPSELVTTILISNIASLPIEELSTPMLFGIFPIIVLVSFELIVSNIALKSKCFRNLLSGNPITIINNGKVDQSMLKKLRLSIDDLMESLRQNSVFNIEDVAYAIAETNGKISILLKHSAQNATAQMLKVKGEDPNLPLVVVSDGKFVKNVIKRYNIKSDWLEKIIKANCQSHKDIFIMTVDEKLNYQIILKGNTVAN